MFEQRTYTDTIRDWEETVSPARWSYKEVAYAMLRVTVGIVFLFSGLGKIMAGVETTSAGMTQQFNGILPSALVSAFAYVLPFIELLVGALIVLGLFNVVALAAAGALMAVLTFGTVMKGDFPTVAHNVMYGTVIFLLLWVAEHNRFSLDHLMHRRL